MNNHLFLALIALGAALLSSPGLPRGQANPAAPPLPPEDAWTESLDFPLAAGRRGRGWSWYHEDKDKNLCKPIPGQTLLLDEVIKTTGRVSIRCRYLSAEAQRIRTDIPPQQPRQIYNVLYLPAPPVNATGYDALEFDLRCLPEGAVTAIRILIGLQSPEGRSVTVASGAIPFLGGSSWRRFGLDLKRLRPLGQATGTEGPAAPDLSRCERIVIDVRIAAEALRQSEFVDLWLDGLRFVQGESPAAEQTARQAPASPVAAPDTSPTIAWEDLGVMVRGRSTLHGSPALGFSTDKDGWSAYAGYRDHIVKRKPWLICEINLQTGKVKHFLGPPEEQSDTWGFQVFPDGRAYTFPGGGSIVGARIARVDWQTGGLQIFGPCPDPWNYCWAWGAADAAIYIGGYRKHHAIRFDPETGDITDYGVQGPPTAGGVYTIAADDAYVYTTVGLPTNRLIACDRKTKEQRILRQVEHPQTLTLNSYDGQIFVRLHPPRLEEGGAKYEEFRLWHARLEPLAERPPRRGIDLPAEAFGLPRPELLRNSAVCLGDGHATLWYRLPGKPWQSLRYLVDDVPSYLFRLGLTGDGRLIGSSEDPYTIFTYDPRTGMKQLLGPTPNMTHIYSFLPHPNGKVYMCGYSGAPLFAWDPQKPWDFLPATPDKPMPDWKDAGVNPLQVARMYRQRRAYQIVRAADGRLYLPCSAYVETMPGGCLGWYDPDKDEAGLIREGFESWRGNDACTALNGRYVVVTTVPWPESPQEKQFVLTDPHDLLSTKEAQEVRYRGPEGQTGKRLTPEATLEKLLGGRKSRTVTYDASDYVVTYDTETQAVVGRLPLGQTAGGSRGLNGRVCEWKPGLVVVRANAPNGSRYGLLDVRSQKLEFKLDMPPANANPGLLPLPDGRIAAVHQNNLVLIDPADWSWRSLGKLRPLTPGREAAPADWLILDGELYFVCGTQLGRIRNFAAPGRE